MVLDPEGFDDSLKVYLALVKYDGQAGNWKSASACARNALISSVEQQQVLEAKVESNTGESCQAASKVLANAIVFLGVSQVSFANLKSNAGARSRLHAKSEAEEEHVDVVQDYLCGLDGHAEEATQEQHGLEN